MFRSEMSLELTTWIDTVLHRFNMASGLSRSRILRPCRRSRFAGLFISSRFCDHPSRLIELHPHDLRRIPRAHCVKFFLAQAERFHVAAHQAHGFDGVGEKRLAGIAR